jgi:hypothetical protein
MRHQSARRPGVRGSALAAALFIAALASACLPHVIAPAPGAEWAESRELEGVLTLVYGDPPPPAQQGTTLVALSAIDGRSWQLLPDPASSLTSGDLLRLDRRRVRVVGRFMHGDTLVFWASRIDSLPPSGR